MRIQTKSVIIFLILSLAPLLIIGVIAYQIGKETIKESLGASFQQIAHETINMVDRHLYEVYNNLQTWAELDIMQDIVTGDIDGKLSSFLMGLSREYGYFAEINVLNSEGEVIASSKTKLIGRDFKFKLDDFYKNSVSGRDFLEDAYLHEISKDWVVSFFFPIKAQFEKDKVIGLLFAGWKVDELSNLVKFGEEEKEEPFQGRLMLMRRDGLVLLSSAFEKEAKYKLNLFQSSLKPVLLARQKARGFLVETDERNQKSLIAYDYSTGYRDFTGLGWTAFVFQDVNTVFAPIEKLKIIILGVGAVVGLIVITISFVVTRKMTNPILQISQVAGRVAKGNFEEEVNYTSGDEIGYLARTFNQMIRDLRGQRSKLVESETRFRTVIETVGEGIITIDSNGTIIMVNKEFQSIFGYSQNELIGKNIQMLVPDPYRTHFASMNSYLNSGIPHILHHRFELEGLNKNGYTFPIEISIAETKINESIFFTGAVRDITERKHAEEALTAEKERLAVTLRSIGEGVITTDINGKVILINKVAEKLTNWTQKEAFGKPLIEVFHIINVKTHDRLENPAEKVLKTGEILSFAINTALIARGGNSPKRIISHSCAPIRDKSNKIIGVVLVIQDVTDKQKMAEELFKASKLESTGILAGGLAHDFNNLLTGILGNLSLALTYVNPGNQPYNILTEAEDAAIQAKDLTQQLLTFSKGGIPIRKTVSIAELIKNSASFALRGSNVNFIFSVPDNLWSAKIDKGQISQVINNMIINATQAMQEGGTIKIEGKNINLEGADGLSLQKGSYIHISIKDKGSGIPRENLQKIFDPYFTTKREGTGLGLATSYSIINKHGGLITVESDLGVGTTFHIYLPASPKEVPEKVKSLEEKPISGKGKILLMDDKEVIIKVAGNMLSRIGFGVEFARDGAEAINLYKKALESGEPYDAVIMDLTIPGGMGGKEAIKKLLAIDPQIKAIVSSGYSTDPIMAEFKKYGFSDVVVKPYRTEELSKVLHKVMKKRKNN